MKKTLAVLLCAAFVLLAGCTAIQIKHGDWEIGYKSILQNKTVTFEKKSTDTLNLQWETNSDPAVQMARMAFEAGKEAGKIAAGGAP